MPSAVRFGVALALAIVALPLACTSARDREAYEPSAPDGADGAASSGGGFMRAVPEAGIPDGEVRDPSDCDEARATKSYVGCDYWPVVTPNGVWSIFDFAVVVANTGKKDASITVTGPGAVNEHLVVPSGEARKIYLPWVPNLKGGDIDECGNMPALGRSIVESGGAYHLVSTSPVIVYQFNALEYKGVGGRAPDGGTKDWSTCPGSSIACAPPPNPLFPDVQIVPYKIGCFSFTNDASLLLPSTALTGNYRVTGERGWSKANGNPIEGAFVSITATEPNTNVTVTLGSAASVVGSVQGPTVIPDETPGGVLHITLAKAGDVILVATPAGRQHDLSGSLVQASAPVQVIAGNPCTNIPSDIDACDHIEETVLPIETLGKHYIVPTPTGPKGVQAPHMVRLYGNVDGTTLTYSPTRPGNCPPALNAGEFYDCGVLSDAFEVTGNHEFAVSTFLVGARDLDPSGMDRRGDPSASNGVAVEQFRTSYLFLAPDDYSDSFVDITAPTGSTLVLDGAPVTAPVEPIGAGPFGVLRVKLGAGKGGVHSLTSSSPAGVQVLGYGDNTSYMYPGGLNLSLVAPAPPAPK
jgi:hypothetical protein